MNTTYSVQQLSLLTGQSRKTVTALLDGARCPYVFDRSANARRYDFAKAAPVLFGRIGVVANINESKERRAAAEADKAEIQVAALRGKLFEMTAIQEVVRSEYDAVRQRLLAIPGAIAPALRKAKGAEEHVEVLDAAVRQALEDLCLVA